MSSTGLFCRYLEFLKNRNSRNVLNLSTNYLVEQNRRYVSTSVRHLQQNAAENVARPETVNSSFGSPKTFDRFSSPSTSSMSFGVQNDVQRRLMLIENDIRRFGRIDPNRIEAFLSFLRPNDRLSSNNALTLLRACGANLPMYSNEKRVDLLHRIWKKLPEFGVKYDVSHYNTLLALYLFNEHEFSPVEFLATLEKENVEANRVTFQRLVQRFARIGDIKGAGKILEHMKSLNLPLNEQVFNALIYANIKTKNASELKSVFEIMEKNNLELSNETYMEMMRAYAEMGDLTSVEKILSEQAEIIFSDYEILEVLYHFVKNGHANFAADILKHLRKTSGYIHDAVNCSLRLNAIGASDVAVEVLSTVPKSVTSTGQVLDFGSVLLRQAVDLDFNEDQIMSLSENMKRKNLHKRGVEMIYVIAAEKHKKDLASAAMTALLADKTFPIRAQCFWPLILMSLRQKNMKAVEESLALMINSGLKVDVGTLTDWIWPNVTPDETPRTLSNKLSHVPLAKAATSFLSYSLKKADREKINETLDQFGSDVYASSQLIENLERFVFQTKDAKTCAAVLSKIQANLVNDRFFNMPQNPFTNFFGQCAYALPEEFQLELFKELAEKGICASPNVIDRVKHFAERLNSEVLTNLEKMVENLKEFRAKRKNSETFVVTQEFLKENFEAKNYAKLTSSASSETLNEILFDLAKNNKVETMLELYREVEKSGKMAPAPGVFLSMSSACIRAKDADNALKFLKTALKSNIAVRKEPLLDFACFLVDKRRFADVFDVLAARRPSLDENAPPTSHAVMLRLLDGFVKESRLDDAQRLLKVCVENQLCQPNSTFYIPLVNHYLEKKELSKIVELYEDIGRRFKFLPEIVSTMTALADASDRENLQKVYDLTVKCRSESVAVVYLALALSNAGKFRQSSYLLKNAGDQLRVSILMKYAAHAMTLNNSKNLENLLKTTKNISQMDRELIYKYLLMVYQRQNDLAAATNVWTQMQEDNFAPNEEIVAILAKIYETNGKTSPFLVVGDAKSPAAETNRRKKENLTPMKLDAHFLLKDLITKRKTEEQVKNLLEEGKPSAAAALWMYQLLNNRLEEAEQLLASTTNSAAMLKEIKLITLCTDLKFFGRADVLRYLLSKRLFNDSRRIIYSYLIGTSMNERKLDAACEIINEAASDGVSIDRLNQSILARLSSELKLEGKSVPFNLEGIQRENIEKTARLKKSGEETASG